MGITRLQPNDSVLESIRAGMQESITKACEPIIQQAIKECETTVRQCVAQLVIARLERGYSVERCADVLTIRVSLGKEI